MKYKGFEILVTCKRLETWTVDPTDGRPLEFEDDSCEMEIEDYFVSLPETKDGCVSMDELRADSVKGLKKLIKEYVDERKNND